MNQKPGQQLGRLATAAILGGLTVHALPALTALPALRGHLPRLQGAGRPGHVALTLDDGPDPGTTPLFLDLLAENRVWATFFVLGTMLVRRPDLGRRIVAEGHEIAVHGWEHRCLLGRGPLAVRRDLRSATELVAGVTGETPVWFRPPYGVLTASAWSAARGLGLRPVLWTAWGRDWTARATPGGVAATVCRDLDRQGVGRPHGPDRGTVLLHDSDCTSSPGSAHVTLGALPLLLRRWRDNGTEVGPLREHLDPERSLGVPGRS